MSHDADANASYDRLRLLIARVERLEEEKKGIADDISDDRREMESILERYKNALGLV